jgi:hypothetical protein
LSLSVCTIIKKILQSSCFWVLLVPVLVTVPLTYVTLTAPAVVEVIVIPANELKARILTRSILTRSYDGPAYIDFSAELGDPGITEALLQLRPIASQRWFDTILNVVNGRATGVVQLGSTRWPLTAQERYTFRLIDTSSDPRLINTANDPRLAEGDIYANAEAVAMDEPRFIIAIGFLAALIEIAHALATQLRKARLTPGNDVGR